MTSPSADERKRRAFIVSAHTWANEALTALDQCRILAEEGNYKIDPYRMAFTRKYVTELIDGLHTTYMNSNV